MAGNLGDGGCGAIAGWDLVAGGNGIAATPPTNTFNVDPDLAKRFHAVEEFDAPPMLSANFAITRRWKSRWGAFMLGPRWKGKVTMEACWIW